MISSALDKYDLLLQQLKSKLDNVRHQLNKLGPLREYGALREGPILIPFYQSISYFVNFIRTNEELLPLFNDLLFFEEKQKSQPGYSEFLRKIDSLIKSIARTITLREDYEKFCASCSANFLNPITNLLPFLPPKQIFDLFQDKNFINGLNFPATERSISVLESILTKYNSDFPSGWENLVEDLDAVSKLKQVNKYLYEYLPSYNNVESAVHLQVVDEAINPLTFYKGELDEKIVKSEIYNGRFSVPPDDLLNDCEIIFAYIQQTLFSKADKDRVIVKFKNYAELYLHDKIDFAKNEEHIQSYFEEFLFLHDYYPIAQAKLAKGKMRTDVIAFTTNASFLYEVKKFDQNERTLRGGLIQAHRYLESLKSLPGIDNHAYILIFTNRDTIVNNPQVTINEMSFHFVFVNLSKISPSKTKTIIEVDCEELITKSS